MIKNILDGETGKLIEYVKSIDLYMDENYINEVFASCVGVVMPASGGIAMDAACGPYDSKSCSAKRWYAFMGDEIENDYVPFGINYKFDNEARAFRAKTKKCNESYPNSSACSCVDCHLSCPVGEEPMEDLKTEITLFIFIFCIILIALLLVTSIVIVSLRFPGKQIDVKL